MFILPISQAYNDDEKGTSLPRYRNVLQDTVVSVVPRCIILGAKESAKDQNPVINRSMALVTSCRYPDAFVHKLPKTTFGTAAISETTATCTSISKGVRLCVAGLPFTNTQSHTGEVYPGFGGSVAFYPHDTGKRRLRQGFEPQLCPQVCFSWLCPQVRHPW